MKNGLPVLQRSFGWRTLSGRISLLCLAASGLSLAAGAVLAGQEGWLVLAGLLTLGWGAGAGLGWARVVHPGFIVLAFCAAAGLAWGLSPLLMLMSLCFSLAAWDLQRLALRLAPNEHSTALERAHLPRLGLILLAGGGLAGAALLGSLNLRLHLGLGQSILLVLALGLALALAFAGLKRK